MPILVPVYDFGTTMQEVPNHISFFIEFGECTQQCKECHSPHLWRPIRQHMDIEDIVSKAERMVEMGANAIVLMGGTTNNIPLGVLLMLIDKLAEIAPVCLYSGSGDLKEDFFIAKYSNLTWLKTGSYEDTLGGLQSPKTNQRFYRKEKVAYSPVDTILIDETYKFKIYE